MNNLSAVEPPVIGNAGLKFHQVTNKTSICKYFELIPAAGWRQAASQRRRARDAGQPRPAMLGLHHQPSHLTAHQAVLRSGAECGRPARRSDLMWSTAAQAAGCTALYNCTPRHRPHLATSSISFTLTPKTLTIHFKSFHRRLKPNRFCLLVSWSKRSSNVAQFWSTV